MPSLARKSSAYLRAHGLRKTINRARARFSEICHEWPQEAWEWYCERRLGINTASKIELAELGIDKRKGQHRRYEPTDYRTAARAMRQLNVRKDKDVFLDYGAGMGRAVIVAGTYPFRKVIGVELSGELNRIARDNVRRATRKLKCKNIVLVTADAATYDMPAEVTHVFLYNPFQGKVLSAVLENIQRSIETSPRKLTLIYKNPKVDLCQYPWLAKLWEFPCYHGNGKVVAFEGCC